MGVVIAIACASVALDGYAECETGGSEVVTFDAERFAHDVTLHVVLHELAHALVREFDLPVLGNEETLADAFATHYLTTHMPDRAHAVLEARITSLMIEAEELARNEWPVSGEHNSDARRAYQIAAIAIAADLKKYADLGRAIGMSEDDISSAADYGTEIHRSWRRVLRPLWMPRNQRSNETRITFDDSSDLIRRLSECDLVDEIETALWSFDWHSQVTIAFIEGDGGAGWNRSRRTITVNSAYIERFVQQGKLAAEGK